VVVAAIAALALPAGVFEPNIEVTDDIDGRAGEEQPASKGLSRINPTAPRRQQANSITPTTPTTANV
jgi:hypothetical protein